MPLTPETWLADFIVNLTTTGGANNPSITQLTNGNIVVSWDTGSTNPEGDGNGRSILAQIFDPLGNLVGTEFQLNNASVVDDETDAEIVALDSGGFVVVYEDNDGTPGIRLEEYSATGAQVSENALTTNVSADEYRNPSVASSSSTSVFVMYEKQTNNVGDFTLAGKVYNPTTNTYSAEISLLAGRNFNSSDLVALNNGNYVIAGSSFESGTDESVYFRIISSTGVNVRSFTELSHTGSTATTENNVSVAALTGGGFVIAYQETDSVDTDVFFQRFSASGVEQGGRVGVATGGTDNNNEPEVVALSDGGFLIIYDNDTDNRVDGQRYSSTGALVGSTFTLEASGGSNIEAELLGDGRVAVTWDDGNIRMEIIDTRDAATAGGYSGGDSQIGTIGNDTFTANVSGAAYGYDGNDTITDGAGIQDIYGGDGNDTIRVAEGTATESYFGDAGLDTIQYTGSGASTIDLTADTLTAGGQTSTIEGFERVIGGTGNDSITGSFAAETLFGGNGDDSILGNNGGDFLYGGNDNDTIQGGFGEQTLYGGADDDTLVTGVGEFMDDYYGGSGIDTLDNSALTLASVDGDLFDFDAGSYTSTFTTGGGGVLSSIERYRDGLGGNTITFGGTLNSVDGGAGDDIINVANGDGTVTIVGGAGTDTLDLSSSTSGWSFAGSVGSTTGTTANTSGIEIIIGTGLADTLVETGSVDEIFGGVGNDTIIDNGGASLADSFFGGLGNDTFDHSASSSSRTFDMTTGSFSGHGTVSQFENVIMGSGNDSITGTTGVNTIDGGAGNDTIDGNGGADVVFGGAGDDNIVSSGNNGTYYGGNDNDLMFSELGGETMYGGSGIDTINHTAFGGTYEFDMVTGLTNFVGELYQGFENVVMGAGNDTVTGTTANNTITMGAGNDTVNAGDGNDIINGGAGVDILNGEIGNDTISGNNGNDVMDGGDGNDTLLGQGDADDLFGGIGDDSLNGGAGFDDIYGGAGIDDISGGSGNDYIDGGNDADIINGVAGSDTIDGGLGNDSILGGNGFDLINGENGFDDIDSGLGNDTVYGGNGNDTILGNAGSDDIYGGANNDLLEGQGGNDELFGGGGADDLFGGVNNDTMDGGLGTDVLTGGTGADDFVFVGNFGNDTVTDFLVNVDDADFSGFASINTFAQWLAASSQVGADVVTSAGGQTVTFEGTLIGSFDAADFIF